MPARRVWRLDGLVRLVCHWRGTPSQYSGDRAQFGLWTNSGSGIGIHPQCESDAPALTLFFLAIEWISGFFVCCSAISHSGTPLDYRAILETTAAAGWGESGSRYYRQSAVWPFRVDGSDDEFARREALMLVAEL